MNVIEFMGTDEYKALAERYEKQFNDKVATFNIFYLDVEEFKQEIEQAIQTNTPLLIMDGRVY